MQVKTKEYFIAVGWQARKVKLHVQRWQPELKETLLNMFSPLEAQRPASLLRRLLKIILQQWTSTHFLNYHVNFILNVNFWWGSITDHLVTKLSKTTHHGCHKNEFLQERLLQYVEYLSTVCEKLFKNVTNITFLEHSGPY